MGKSLQRHGENEKRERREMYLLLILLVSPAFGRPSSDRRDVGANIENRLENLVGFSNETGKLWSNSKLLEKVSQSVEEAGTKILVMEAHFESMKSRIPKLEGQEDFFPDYNKAKSFLSQTRQELRGLAKRTKREIDILNLLLDALDNSKDPDMLRASVDRLKILMKETKKGLEEANKKYHSAKYHFDNLLDSLRLQNKITANFLKQEEDDVAADKKYTEIVRDNCKIASWFTFGLCSFIHHFVNEVPLKDAIEELEDLREEIDTFMKSATNVSVDIDAAIEILLKELDNINSWEISAEKVRQNIVDFPEETMKEYPATKNIFRNGLNDLYRFADQFLNISSEYVFNE